MSKGIAIVNGEKFYSAETVIEIVCEATHKALRGVRGLNGKKKEAPIESAGKAEVNIPDPEALKEPAVPAKRRGRPRKAKAELVTA